MKRSSNTSAAPSREDEIARLVEQLRRPHTGATIGDWLVDRVADSAQYTARVGAAVTTAWDNATDAYSLERERQLRRRAERLYNKALALA